MIQSPQPSINSHLREAILKNRRVFLRADSDVPHKGNLITNDFRLTALEPTLKLLIEKEAKIILATHINRPKNRDPHHSTQFLLPWFKQRKYQISWAATLEEALQLSNTIPDGSILLIENLRYYEGEQNQHNQAEEFAKQLSLLADYYVNDAFALLHRMDTSITLLPSLYAPENKSIGLLIKKELKEFDKLKNPQRPFLVLVGGGKVHDKLPYIEKLIEHADTVIILPALACTFLKAQGIEMGKSLVDDAAIPLAKKIMEKAQSRGTKILLPTDYLISSDSLDGPLLTTNSIPPNGICLSIGEQSLELFSRTIKEAATIFLNGAMGFFERPETMEPLKKLLHTIAQTNALSIIGGGESVAAVYLYNLQYQISFCSTGGGSALYYVSYGNFPSLAQAGLL